MGDLGFIPHVYWHLEFFLILFHCEYGIGCHSNWLGLFQTFLIIYIYIYIYIVVTSCLISVTKCTGQLSQALFFFIVFLVLNVNILKFS